MENSATYDAFQHELEDYIRKQRARGLQPEIRFRKVTEGSEYGERDGTAPEPPMLEPSLPCRSSHGFPGPYKRLGTADSPLPRWSNIHRSAPRPESLIHGQKNHYFFKNPWLPSPPVRGSTAGPHAARGRDAARRLREGRPHVHQAGDQDRGRGRRSREEGGDLGQEQPAKRRQKKRGAEGEASREKGRRPEAEPGSQEKRERGKSDGEQGAPSEGSRSRREKQPPGKGSSQERGQWDLWDEAILGSCC
ncbi:hypothetical protein QTO34_006403 [Cnephaeus nilssonii]|uniref:Uncharacterized protein n=1 Tax=Cnephaeus nilssonii TaxID=3371016 RepID=A0AA40HKG2_CNENI|nr:hypothetical protein QTO34_006403 [Eptesicus nilssonii]